MTSDDSKLSSKDLDEMLDVSNLTYLAEDDANLVVERTQKIQYADSPSYSPSSNSLVIVNWQTGEDYISAKDSSLRFTLTLNPGGAAPDTVVKFTQTGSTGGGGSILNIFKRIRVISRSGVVLADIDEANLLNYLKTKYHHTHEWRTQQQGAGLLGFGQDLTQTTTWDVPLSCLSGLFDLDELLPSMLCRGVRIEINLASVGEAFYQETQTVALADYEISQVQCNLDSYRLSSGAVNKLNEMSQSKAGLVLQYYDYENSRFDKPAGASNFSAEVRKVASMANSVFSVVRPQAAGTPLQADDFKSIPSAELAKYQFRIGSLYLPVQEVEGKTQFYQQVNYSLGKLNNGHELGVRFSEFDENLMAVASIDRYWLKNSGLAINNSTSLTWISELAGASVAAARRVDIFLKHTRSLSIYLQNVVKSD